MSKKHVVVEVRDPVCSVFNLCPREGESLVSWGVSERENAVLVVVWAVFKDEKGEQRQHDEWVNSSILHRVYEEGTDDV